MIDTGLENGKRQQTPSKKLAVSSTVGGLVLNDSIISNVDTDKLSLNGDSLPILTFFAKFKHLTSLQSLQSKESIDQINACIAKSPRCADIEVYWTQALKLFLAGNSALCLIILFFASLFCFYH
jgi:hypothetical protein